MPYFKNENINLLFIHIPKTGGTSIEQYLKKKYLIELKRSSIFGRYNNFKQKILCNKWIQHLPYKLIFKFNNLFNITTDNLSIFSVVRNPYDRIISAIFFNVKYINPNASKAQIYITLKDILSKRNIDFHFKPMYYFLTDENDNLIDNIKILRTESLNDDMIKYGYSDFDNWNNKSRVHIKKGLDYNYTNYLNSDTIKLINTFYEKDFILFNYDMIEITPIHYDMIEITPIHFCSFGSFGYEKALKRIHNQALKSNFFLTIDLYNETNTPNIDIHREFISKNKRGYGYWLWKPLVILDMMNKYEKDSIIIYADAGCEIIKTDSTVKLFNKYIEDVKTHPSHILGFVIGYTECAWTKNDLFNYLDTTNNDKNSNQICAGIQILLNNERNKKLMEEWLHIMTINNYHYVDDSPSIIKNHIKFKEHRHDQSVFSLLRKKYGFCPEKCHSRILPIHPSRKRKC